MAEIKWIKLNVDMFDNRKIKQIRKLPGGNDMVLFWVMLLTLAGRSNSQGYILFTENIPYTPEMLATECDIELNTVKMALEMFSKFNMITINREVITVTGWAEHQNIEGMERAKLLANERVKKHRAKKKELLKLAQEETCSDNCNGYVTLHETLRNDGLTHLEEEVDIEEDKDNNTTTTKKVPVANVDKSDYIMFFNNNMGHLMTPHELEIFNSFTEDGMENSVITLAIEESIEANARDMRYIKSILNRWLTNGLKTFEAVMADKKNWEDRKKAKEQKTQYSKTTKVDTFNNYQQRDYDFDDLERKLLGRDVQEGDNH